MSHPATLAPVREPLYTEPFLVLVQGGLFAAPWLGRPARDEPAAVAELSRSLAEHDHSPSELAAALSYLLAIRRHCLEAAQATTPARTRASYGEALWACETAMKGLHHAQRGTTGALAAWAQGVHTLIRAQLAMPDMAATETLARQAMIQLSLIEDPLCAGAEADAHAATLLAREPAELGARLSQLPAQALDRTEYIRHRIDTHESTLNQHLAAVTDAHRRALVDSVGWGLLNLLFMASMPLNGVLRPDLPWSVPFVLAVPLLWLVTWDRPYKTGLRFFDYLRAIKAESLAAFHQAAQTFPDPEGQFRSTVVELLRQGRADRERLADYCLGELPAACDRLDEAAVAADEGHRLVAGQWMVELKDRAPWPLADVLPVDPSMLPWSTRVYFG